VGGASPPLLHRPFPGLLGRFEMKLSEQAVFRWVVIIGVAAASVIVLTLLTSSLVGALWGLVLVCAAAWHGYRWLVRQRRES